MPVSKPMVKDRETWCLHPWGHKESQKTEQLNNNKKNKTGLYQNGTPTLPQRLGNGVLSSDAGWNDQYILLAALSVFRQTL